MDLIKKLLDYKAETGGTFSKEEARKDLELCPGCYRQKDLAKRWGWSQSSVSRFLHAENGPVNNSEYDLNNSEYSTGENSTKNSDIEQVVNNSEYDLNNSEYIHNKSGSSKESFSPTPPFQRNSPPPPIKKKINKKENSPSPTDSAQEPEKQNQEPGAAAASGGHLRLVESEPATNQPKDSSIAPEILEHVEPFSLEDAKGYFAGRLKTDETARKRGFDAGLLANSFYWHWRDRSFTDKEGKRIDVKSWKRRAGTWWSLKEKYNPEAAKKVASGGLSEDRWTFK